MFKFWVVLAQTFMTRFKSKSFMITTAIFLVFIFAIGNIDRIISLFDSGEEETDVVAIVDETNRVGTMLVEMTGEEFSHFQYQQVDNGLEDVQTQVIDGEYAAVLHITEGAPFQATFYTEQLLNNSLEYDINQQLQQIKVVALTEEAGISQAVINEIYEPVNFETAAIESPGGSEQRTEEEVSGARGLVYAMLFLLYFAVLTYGQMIATDVANEKTSRVMEILISSSSPVSQMFAKISGIALLGLTQISILILAAFFMIEQRQADLDAEFFEFFGFNDIPVATYIYAIVFFLLGYLLYATLSAMLGSLVSRMEDVGQLMFPVIILVIIAFMLSMFGLDMPDSEIIRITSFIPFFAPLVMFLRVGLLNIPFYEVMLSIGILVATIAVLGYLGAKIYRGGVLMYGTGVKLKDFKHALQLGKKDK